MTLVDTSVWVAHLRAGHRALVSLLNDAEVLTHPFVVGELACGQMHNRREILALLHALPGARVAGHDEVLAFVEDHALFGRGVGWIDAHLLASALLSDARLLTLDRRLSNLAGRVGVRS